MTSNKVIVAIMTYVGFGFLLFAICYVAYFTRPNKEIDRENIAWYTTELCQVFDKKTTAAIVHNDRSVSVSCEGLAVSINKNMTKSRFIRQIKSMPMYCDDAEIIELQFKVGNSKVSYECGNNIFINVGL